MPGQIGCFFILIDKGNLPFEWIRYSFFCVYGISVAFSSRRGNFHYWSFWFSESRLRVLIQIRLICFTAIDFRKVNDKPSLVLLEIFSEILQFGCRPRSKSILAAGRYIFLQFHSPEFIKWPMSQKLILVCMKFFNFRAHFSLLCKYIGCKKIILLQIFLVFAGLVWRFY